MWKWRSQIPPIPPSLTPPPPPGIPEIRMEVSADNVDAHVIEKPSQEPINPSLGSQRKPSDGEKQRRTVDSAGVRETRGSVDFRLPDQLDPTSPVSPTPSVDRLSVSFGPSEVFSTGGSSTRSSLGSSSAIRMSTTSIPDENPSGELGRVRFSKDYLTTSADDDDADDDYSASLDAMLQRRLSKRRGSTRRSPSRRLSSPFGSDIEYSRRRSSTMTITSGETQISIEENEIPEEEIMENIRMHKEVLESVKTQAWRTQKKLKVARQAKAYVKKHEGLLEQRLAQSKSTKDIMARYKLIFYRHSARLHREASNLASVLIPWENRIKRIECHFGSSVASYFTFLRWVFWINIVISIMIGCFIIIPEVLAAEKSTAGDRKELLPEEMETAFDLQTLWEFEGWLKYTPIFYGYYTNEDKTKAGYRLPFAYFMASIGMYAYSFWAILKKMAENSRMSKMSEKDEEYTFTWKLFTSWDYMIGNSETSQNKVASLIMGFKEVVLEEQEKKKEGRNWKIIVLRSIANFLVLGLLASSAYAVVLVVARSEEPEGNSSWWRKNELTVIMAAISNVCPNIFEVIGMMENYHPRNQLQWQLSRIWVLNMLTLYSLNFALFEKIDKMSSNLTNLQPNVTTLPVTTTVLYTLTSLNDSSSWTTHSPMDVLRYVNTSAGVFNLTGLDPNCTVVAVNCSEISTTWVPAIPMDGFTVSLDDESYINVTLETPIVTNISIFDALSTTMASFLDFNEVLPRNLSTQPFYLNTTFIILSEGDIYGNVTSQQQTPLHFEFGATVHPGLKVMNLIFLPPDLLAKHNLSGDLNTTITGFNETDVVNLTDFSQTVTAVIDDWLSTTIDQKVVTGVTNVTIVLTTTTIPLPTTTTESNTEEPEVATLVSTTTTTTIPISTYTSGDESCYAIRCPDPAEVMTDLTDSTVSVTWTPVVETTDDHFISTVNGTEVVTTGKSYGQWIYRGTEVDIDTRVKLRPLCWETMFGQEIVKITVMDLLLTVGMSLIMDFIRAIFVRVMNKCCCWDLEKQFPGYGDFKIAENILHLIQNQGMIWMGTFFSPGLPLINTVKLVVLMYIRSWAVLTCNIPHETVFKASGSNNFYYALLLTMLFVCTLPVSYAVIWLTPSWHCGPFSDYPKIYNILTQSITRVMPDNVNSALNYLTSASIVIPLMLLLTLIIYYLLSLARSLREANKDLKDQLRRERTEERRKVFQMTDGVPTNGQGPGNLGDSKWPAVMKKILPVLPNKKYIGDLEQIKPESEEADKDGGKDKLTRLILMSNDDIFIETEHEEAPIVTVTDETRGDKPVSKNGRSKKNADVPTIKISQAKDGDKNGKKKNKEDKKGKQKNDKSGNEVTAEDGTDSDQKLLLPQGKEKKKKKEKDEKGKKEKEEKGKKDKEEKGKKDKEEKGKKDKEEKGKKDKEEKGKKEKEEKGKKDKDDKGKKDKEDKGGKKDKEEKGGKKDKEDKGGKKDKEEKGKKDKDKGKKDKEEKGKRDKDEEKVKMDKEDKGFSEKQDDGGKSKKVEDKKKKDGKDDGKRQTDKPKDDKKEKKKPLVAPKPNMKDRGKMDKPKMEESIGIKKEEGRIEEIEMGDLVTLDGDVGEEEEEKMLEEEAEKQREKLKVAQLKGDGIFEADTIPLVIEFGTPSSVGSAPYSLTTATVHSDDSGDVMSDRDASEVTVLIQEEEESVKPKESEN